MSTRNKIKRYIEQKTLPIGFDRMEDQIAFQIILEQHIIKVLSSSPDRNYSELVNQFTPIILSHFKDYKANSVAYPNMIYLISKNGISYDTVSRREMNQVVSLFTNKKNRPILSINKFEPELYYLSDGTRKEVRNLRALHDELFIPMIRSLLNRNSKAPKDVLLSPVRTLDVPVGSAVKFKIDGVSSSRIYREILHNSLISDLIYDIDNDGEWITIYKK